MHKLICILISSFLIIPAINFVGVNDVDARNYHQRRQLKRAYAAGAIRSHRRSEVRKHVRKERQRAETRRAVRGAVRLGIGAAMIHNAHERSREHD